MTSPSPSPLNLDWLRKQAKRRLTELRKSRPDAQLADAQFEVAKENGFPSWRALKAHVDSLSIEGQLFEAARRGDPIALMALLEAHPDKLQAREEPYGFTLLHAAAREGQYDTVKVLLGSGLDPNVRETGDNTTPMHWAAAAGKLDVVRRLADAGGDVVGHGDDHEMDVIGWASCWEEADDDAHRAVVDFLLSRGAKHHIFSAIALNADQEVRRLVAANPAVLTSRMSRNENHQTPLHFAVRHNRPQMVALLIELGADPLAADGFGYPPAMYAESPDIDRPIMEAVHRRNAGELDSADRGHRPARASAIDLLASVVVRDWPTAQRLAHDNPDLLASGGVLHLATKRGDRRAVEWFLEHGANANARWPHWDSDVTALHLAALANHPETVPLLLAAGADPGIHDTKHDSNALAWAEFFRRAEIVAMLKARAG
jgi:ankyrin repeat protein